MVSQAQQHHSNWTSFWNLLLLLDIRNQHHQMACQKSEAWTALKFPCEWPWERNSGPPAVVDDIAVRIITDCGSLTLDFKQHGFCAPPSLPPEPGKKNPWAQKTFTCRLQNVNTFHKMSDRTLTTKLMFHNISLYWIFHIHGLLIFHFLKFKSPEKFLVQDWHHGITDKWYLN